MAKQTVEPKIEVEAIDQPEVEKEVKKQLPDPKGWKVLVLSLIHI